MTNEKGTPQKMVSTPTLVILVVGLAILGYMLLQPMFAPQESSPVAEQPVASNQPPALNSNNSDTQVQTESGSNSLPVVNSDGTISKRDPFLPSALVITKSDSSLPVPDFKPEPAQPIDQVSIPKAVQTDYLTWKGLVGAENNQLVMIQRNNRTYALRLGDILPGTKYILSEITGDSVLLISPTDQKRLFKKKEAKKNG